MLSKNVFILLKLKCFERNFSNYQKIKRFDFFHLNRNSENIIIKIKRQYKC